MSPLSVIAAVQILLNKLPSLQLPKHIYWWDGTSGVWQFLPNTTGAPWRVADPTLKINPAPRVGCHYA
jgi:hypothetical protein